MIFVSSIYQLEENFKLTSPARMISILGPNDGREWPKLRAPDCNLRIECDDIQVKCSGYTVPTESNVRDLIDFLRAWNNQGDLLIHCKAGTSRSTAAALIAMYLLNPEQAQRAANLLREQAPYARPSQIFLRMADAILGTQDAIQMVARNMPAPGTSVSPSLIRLTT